MECEIRSAKDWMDEFEKEEAIWDADPRPNLGKVCYNKKFNIIELDVYGNGYCYEIDLDRCKTKTEVLNWIFHLTEKTWFKEVAYDLLMMFRKVLPDKLLYR